MRPHGANQWAQLEWARNVWTDESKWCVIGCTRDNQDDWPLYRVRSLRPSQLHEALGSMPPNRSWYCLYTQTHRPMGGYPRRTDVAGGQCLWADIDGYKRQVLHSLPVEPSFVIQTSAEGRHLGWLLDEFQSVEVIEGLTQAIARQWTHTDSVHNASRWMRFPFGWNLKSSHGEPYPVQLLEATYKRYSVEDFGHAGLVIQRDEATVKLDADLGPELAVEDLDRKYQLARNPRLWSRLHMAAPDGHRHQEIYYMVSQLCRRGMTWQEVYWRLYQVPTVRSKFWDGPDAHLVRDPDLAFYQDVRTTYAHVRAEYDRMAQRTVVFNGRALS